MMNSNLSAINPDAILKFFYPDDSPQRRMLLKHSEQVRAKALEILDRSGMTLDRELVSTGALLHDIGILRCHAPGIFCEGVEPYIAHGMIGAEMLRRYAAEHQCDLEPYACICERHTGSGLTAAEIERENLPLPHHDFLPLTPEEKLICLADKFFSKSGDMREKSLEHVRRSLLKFGPDSLERFDALRRLFHSA